MASSSRKGGAGGKKKAAPGSTRPGRPAAKKATPAAAKKRRKGKTGVIAVKRAGVLPRQARARAPRPTPDLTIAPVAPAALEIRDPEPIVALTEPISTAPAAVSVESSDEAQPYAELEVIARTDASAPVEPLVAGTPPASPAPAPTAVSWLRATLRRLAGSRP